MSRLIDFLKERIVVLDGAMGTNLYEAGYRDVPEKAVLEAGEIVLDIHRSFVKAGAVAVETNTFGANRVKLKKYGLDTKVREINVRAAAIARQAAGSSGFVFGSIGPTGLIPEPIGEVGFDFLYEIFKEQALSLKEGGVDAILLETFIDIQEARIAALASLEATGLPVFVTLSFNSELKTDVSATTPEAAVGILEPLGIQGVGANCSLGPKQFHELAERMGWVAERNTVFQPNAGLPKIENGRTLFDATPDDYFDFAKKAVQLGAGIIGGCCGSKPEHIAAIKEAVGGIRPAKMKKRNYFYLCTPQDFYRFDLNQNDFLVIGERINPANRKDLQEDIRSGRYEIVAKEALLQQEAGADVIDINVSVALLDEKKALAEVLKRISYSVSIPVSIDTENADALSEAVKVYPGRPLVNSISAKEKSLKSSFEIARRFGLPFVALAVSDRGIAKTSEEKVSTLKKILEHASRRGVSQHSILFDPVVLTAATNSVKETLDAVASLREEGFYTVFGLSNVSYGLPDRKTFNRAFAVLAASRGLSGAIVDPLDRELLRLVRASRFLVRFSTDLIEEDETAGTERKETEEKRAPDEDLYRAIVAGSREKAAELAAELVRSKKPYDIVSQVISPAMEEVGRLFEEKKFYLPQVLRSAEAVKSAFQVLKPEFLKGGEAAHRARVLLATVEGDVHDIGKSIVKVVLEANGYEVIDLGVDVPAEKIVEAVRRLKPQVVGLSCLMTTTLASLEKTIRALKGNSESVIIAIGGAVVTEAVKEAYGAHVYSKDAIGFAKILNEIFGG